MIEKQTMKQIKHLRINNDKEFYEKEFNEFCKNEGIVRYRTVIHTHKQNSTTEWMNRTLLKSA